jgi:DNA (cytosine-5)-methyltransferase 1
MNKQVFHDLDISGVDLFCGAGGLTFGLEQAGINIKLGVDADESCAHSIQVNTSALFLAEDVTKLPADVLKAAWGDSKIKLLAGCAPCQPFSTYTQGKPSQDDPRWALLGSFARLVHESQPDIVTVENVFQMERNSIFQEFLEELSADGYEYEYGVLDCREYGIPQSRKRLVLIASRFGKPHLPTPTTKHKKQWVSVKDCIGKLPRIRHGKAHVSDRLHISRGLSDLNYERIKASKPGGTWREWPEELVANCHRKQSGRKFIGVYGRMKWNEPSPTITGQSIGFGNGRFGHPSQNRAISLREAAMLQSFPINYSFWPDKQQFSAEKTCLMIGNAVPPKLGKAIGKAILDHVRKFRPET